MDVVSGLKSTIQQGEDKERVWVKALHDLLATMPNTPAADVPVGPDESDNVELRRFGTPKDLPFAPKQHFEIGEALGLMDFEAASKISGARFVVLRGALARLERALAAFMLDMHADEYGYEPVITPPLACKSKRPRLDILL